MITFPLMVISLLFPALSLADGNAPSKSTSTDADRLSVRYHDRLLWAEIRKATLSEVAKALAQQTGLKIDVANPAITRGKVSARVSGLDLDSAIKVILDGYSYVSYPESDSDLPVVRITSMSEQPDPSYHSSDSSQASPPSPAGTATSEVDAQFAAQQARNRDEQSKAAAKKEAEAMEAALSRDLDTLHSSASGDARREALERLVGNEDPRAVAALLEQAVSPASESPEFRANAVEALWRHAADREFADAVAIDALHKLREDKDRRVSAIARGALRDMEQYMAANSATGLPSDGRQPH
ncbi:MAG: HEAT repeat domain-containing protein [Chromatiales bacterium]